jgi:hypothetical protein
MSDISTCPHCGCGYSSHLGADTRAGRFCVQCGQYAGFPDANAGPRLPYACGCGQLSDTPGACDACREADRAPQGEAVRLFTPAPAEMPGQTGFGL